MKTIELTRNDLDWPHCIRVPDGWEYRSYSNPVRSCAEGTTYVNLYDQGNWVELWSPDGTEHELYRFV